MTSEDFKTFSILSQALWANLEKSAQASMSTISAVSLFDLTRERALEKAAKALYEKANSEKAGVNASSLNHPFYRLLPIERFVLTCLHSGKWKYQRLARILDKPEEKIAEIAWSARIHLGGSNSSYPTGSKYQGIHCPEYNIKSPWTQRFLDGEASKQEQFFLQSHLIHCQACRTALNRFRTLYHEVDSQIPKEALLHADLEKAWKLTKLYKNPTALSFKESLLIFFDRTEIKIALLALLVLTLTHTLL